MTANGKMGTRYINAPGDRCIAAHVTGDADGETVYFHHGTPGSRFDPVIEILQQSALSGVRIVTFDRSGYGDSDSYSRRPIDIVDDVTSIADHLDIPPDYVIGRSGGSAYALACAAAARLSIKRVAVLVPTGPRNLMGDDIWYENMTSFNVEAFRAGEDDPAKLDRMLREVRAQILAPTDDDEVDPGFGLSNGDRQLMQGGLRELVNQSHRVGLGPGLAGWKRDIENTQDWGFDPAEVEVPALVWAAGQDEFCPPRHAEWLADRIPEAELYIEPDAVHTQAMERLPRVISWCLTGQYREGPR